MIFNNQVTQAYQFVCTEQINIEEETTLVTCFHLVIASELSGYSDSDYHSGYTVSLNEQTQIERLWIRLRRFFDEGGVRLVISINETKSLWQQQASFIYHLLSIIGTHQCELMLIDFEPQLFSGLLSGAIKSLAQESQRIKFCRITAQDKELFSILPSLYQTCFSRTQFLHYFWGNKQLQQGEWQPLAVTSLKAQPFSGNVLITGGAGALGQMLAEHLASQYQCQVFLLGRNTLSPQTAAHLKHIKAKAYFQADCTNIVEMREIVQYITEHHGAIDHFFHLAGSINDALFVNKTLDDFLKPIAVKLAGTDVLAQLTEEYKTKSVCLFSSLSAVAGNPG